MAPKKAKIEEQELDAPGNDAELDQAIDDLRGVLQADEEGLPSAGNDFGMDFPAAGSSEGFGGDFGTDTDATSSFGGDFGADSGFGGTSEFGGDTPFGGSLGMSDMAATEPGSAMNANLDLIMDIPIDVQIVLGSSRMQVSSLMNLTEGATIALDRRIGEPVDLIVNGRLIGRGEITVLENDETRFGIKLIEVMAVRKT
ncbi:MAG: flagellar motor switch protein FliN [Rhizobium sp.]|nr:flagellar motor switch protein FliN [Rhizobium sp.]